MHYTYQYDIERLAKLSASKNFTPSDIKISMELMAERYKVDVKTVELDIKAYNHDEKGAQL